MLIVVVLDKDKMNKVKTRSDNIIAKEGRESKDNHHFVLATGQDIIPLHFHCLEGTLKVVRIPFRSGQIKVEYNPWQLQNPRKHVFLQKRTKPMRVKKH